MFYRTGLKLQARERLRGSLGNAILVSLICSLLLGETAGLNFNNSADSSENTAIIERLQADDLLTPTLLGILLIVLLVVLFGALLYQIFFANVLKVGMHGWYMRYSRGEYPAVGQLFASLRIYKPALTTMLLKDIYVALWSLLFVIPGIVQGYAYRLVPYIIYENPNLKAEDALHISKEIMRGNKWDLFVFDWSFFLWNLLAAITCGIVGIVYVTPYYRTAEAYVYDALKTDAVYRRQIVSPAIFGMPEQPAQPTV